MHVGESLTHILMFKRVEEMVKDGEYCFLLNGRVYVVSSERFRHPGGDKVCPFL